MKATTSCVDGFGTVLAEKDVVSRFSNPSKQLGGVQNNSGEKDLKQHYQVVKCYDSRVSFRVVLYLNDLFHKELPQSPVR